MEKLRLSIAIGDHPATRALKSGLVEIDGVEAAFPDVRPQVATYRRMIRDREFDVCELAATTYLIARAFGYPLTAIPVFPYRAFHHAGIVVPESSDIIHPKQLEGRKVGVRAYSVTTGVWARGIFAEEYGFDSSKVEWIVDDEEHVRELRLPSNVVHAPEGVSIASMLADGALAAGLAGDAGVGRTGSPLAGWTTAPAPSEEAYRPLLLGADHLAAGWFRRTGILPIHGLITLKAELAETHSWLPAALAEAFQASKQHWLDSIDAAYDQTAEGQKYAKLRAVVGADPLPYGLEANRPAIEALQRMAARQQLLAAPLSFADLFAPVDDSAFAGV